MPDIVTIISGNSYSTNGCIINCFDATIDFPGLEIGARLTPVLASLMEAGFEVYDYDGNGNVTTFFLVRGTTPGCNPLRAVQGRLNNEITVTTGAGTVSGRLIFIGSNVIEIRESTGDLVLIPDSSIEAVI
ncbi:hypothetical protein [Paenibacillus sedimenti]|uniref:Uncharacterized protein n=1 Tax=Paenibacillus sedimenti TaxID=2770274 RepID=A0A926QKC7_9BACL|nr:hypothetical protein [Paenibacillus sedimenti]MBD0381598.1 hypothetical protein [Paenibacillus sedimenti]